LILLAAAAIRFGLLACAWDSPARLEEPDSREYIELSDNLARDAAFGRGGEAEIFRTPGYPFFLIPVSLFGRSWWRAAAVVQILIDVALVYLTFLLATMLCDRRAGLWAAAFQAVATVSVVSSVRILSDGLFAFMLTLAVLLLAHHLRARATWTLVGAAAAAGLACYVRPVGLVFCAVAVLVLLFRGLFARKGLRATGVFAGIVIVAVCPWIVRNYLTADHLGLSSVSAEAAFKFQAPAVLAETRGVSVDQARRIMTERLQDATAGRTLSPGQLARTKLALGLAVVREHPGAYLRQHARGNLAVALPAATDLLEVLGVTTGQQGTLEVWSHSGAAAAVRHYFRGRAWAMLLCAPLAALLLVKYVLVLLCAGRHVRYRMAAWKWLVLGTILVMVLAPGPAGHPRFRVPVAPLLSLCAGAGLAAITRRRGARLHAPPTITSD